MIVKQELDKYLVYSETYEWLIYFILFLILL